MLWRLHIDSYFRWFRIYWNKGVDTTVIYFIEAFVTRLVRRYCWPAANTTTYKTTLRKWYEIGCSADLSTGCAHQRNASLMMRWALFELLWNKAARTSNSTGRLTALPSCRRWVNQLKLCYRSRCVLFNIWTCLYGGCQVQHQCQLSASIPEGYLKLDEQKWILWPSMGTLRSPMSSCKGTNLAADAEDLWSLFAEHGKQQIQLRNKWRHEFQLDLFIFLFCISSLLHDIQNLWTQVYLLLFLSSFYCRVHYWSSQLNRPCIRLADFI